MNLLIDSHVLLWWLAAPDKLSPSAREGLQNPGARVYVSAAVAWELTIKTNLGKLDAGEVISRFAAVLMEKGFFRLAISTDHALRAGMLPRHHNDPFDRMLVAQAQAMNCPIVSADVLFDSYGVRRIW
ncbi:MAG TPA: type II toxin-antitoxin system VapC family toxin [Terriglobales bacterium]|nr:type II toxin-antitoxin system VapC family toxin [Terriglobales bacterium]